MSKASGSVQLADAISRLLTVRGGKFTGTAVRTTVAPWRSAGSGSRMLKISVNDTKARDEFMLEGTLIVLWTNELLTAARWSRADHPSDREIVIDFR